MTYDLETMKRFMGNFNDVLGLELTEVSGDRVTATWSIKPLLHQPYGLVHGGVYASVVETLGSIGSAAWLGDRGRCVGVNNNTDFYRGISEGELTSTATPIHQGRSQQVWLVETHDADGRLISRGQLRVQNLDHPARAESNTTDRFTVARPDASTPAPRQTTGQTTGRRQHGERQRAGLPRPTGQR